MGNLWIRETMLLLILFILKVRGWLSTWHGALTSHVQGIRQGGVLYWLLSMFLLPTKLNTTFHIKFMLFQSQFYSIKIRQIQDLIFHSSLTTCLANLGNTGINCICMTPGEWTKDIILIFKIYDAFTDSFISVSKGCMWKYNQ